MTRSTPTDEERFAVEAAIGRIFRMMMRPGQSGDDIEYERCRAAILDVVDPADPFVSQENVNTAPDYIRDRRRGAAGQ